ncbi:MAG: hypothetical protein H6673_04435 [Anaerolineales bacterium]|nr:hypothetical protein [Anaerolineales bacterium]
MADALQELQKALKKADFEARYDKGKDVPHVYITLDDTTLELARVSDAQAVAGEDAVGEVDYLQCYASLPFAVTQVTAAAEFMAYLNGIIPLVGFGLMRYPVQAVFRHLLVFESKNFSHATVIEAVDTIQFLLATFGSTLAAVASGQQTVAEALADMP